MGNGRPPSFVLVHGVRNNARAGDPLARVIGDPERLGGVMIALTRADAREYVRAQ